MILSWQKQVIWIILCQENRTMHFDIIEHIFQPCMLHRSHKPKIVSFFRFVNVSEKPSSSSSDKSTKRYSSSQRMSSFCSREVLKPKRLRSPCSKEIAPKSKRLPLIPTKRYSLSRKDGCLLPKKRYSLSQRRRLLPMVDTGPAKEIVFFLHQRVLHKPCQRGFGKASELGECSHCVVSTSWTTAGLVFSRQVHCSASSGCMTPCWTTQQTSAAFPTTTDEIIRR